MRRKLSEADDADTGGEMALEIRHIIATSSVLRKLKMRISQQANHNSNMVKEIVKPETVLQCYNLDLNWENEYAGLENNPFSGKISSVKIRHTAAQIESCFIYQATIVESRVFCHVVSS